MSVVMPTSQFIKQISAKTGLSAKDTKNFITTMSVIIQDEVKAGRGVALSLLGRFKQVERKARMARNPQDGSQVKVKARLMPKFSPGKSFIEFTNTGKRALSSLTTKVAPKPVKAKPVKAKVVAKPKAKVAAKPKAKVKAKAKKK